MFSWEMLRRVALVFAVGGLFTSQALAAPQKFSFDSPDTLSQWDVQGKASIDSSVAHGKSSGSLKVEPGATLTLKTQNTDGAGSASFWVYDDGKKPANPNAKHAGPRWGILKADGSALVVGHLYAPYLKGTEAYAAAEAPLNGPEVNWLGGVQYLGTKRKADAWQQWSFDFDGDKGLTIAVNGKPVSRFDWNKTQAKGMVGAVILGDADKKSGQTVWIDDVAVAGGGQVVASPTPPPPASPVVPESDPAPTHKVELPADMRGRHPRLFFTAEDIPAIRQRYQQDDVARKKIEEYVKRCQPFDKPGFLNDATDGQRQGLWMMPTLALHYIATGDTTSRDKAIEFLEKLVELEHWELGDERDSGMSAGNVMIGAAMVYDMLYNELPEDLRKKAADKLLLQARAMIHGGHLMKNPGIHFWQNDPANNHRWHRDAGLTLCLLAMYEGQPQAQWAMEFLEKELAFIAKWLPEDGTNHEGPGYLIFGLPHLVLAMNASDHVLGTDYLKSDYFAKTPWFETQAMRPGLRDFMPYGDSGGLGFYFGGLYAGASVRGDAEAIVALDKLRELNPNAFMYAWMDLLWRDGTLVKPDTNYDLPIVGKYPDLGITFMRDSWDNDAVAAMFKCGPLGGKSLNKYREQTDPYGYINVAHCDPDANSFTLAMGNQLVAETSRYSGAKRSSSHNTILINGIGQTAVGRKEGQVWSQPSNGNNSMLDDAVILSWDQQDDGTLVIEGEAAGSYPAVKGKRPQIDRFRRLFVWKPGAYVLVLDDVRSPEPVDVSWLVQGPKLKELSRGEGLYSLDSSKESCPFQLVSDQPFASQIGTSTADAKKRPLGWQQLRATADGVEKVRFASVFMPWGGDASVTLQADGEDGATVEVRYPNGTDHWHWEFATEDDQPSVLEFQ